MDLDSVPRAIREAGFRPKDMNLVAAGEFDRDGQGFTPEGWKGPLRVTEGAPREATPRHARIEASIHGWDDETLPIALHIVSIEPAD